MQMSLLSKAWPNVYAFALTLFYFFQLYYLLGSKMTKWLYQNLADVGTTLPVMEF